MPANVTTQTFNIPVLGDLLKEPTETFFVNFSVPSNAVLVTTQIVVSIFDDDTLELPSGFGVSLLDTNLYLPTALEFSPDGRLFVCEQSGNVRVFQNGIRLPEPFLQVQATTEDFSEAGLLGIAFDPAFPSNHYVYVYYTVPANYLPPTSQHHNRVSRFTSQGNITPTNTEQVVIDFEPVTNVQIHNGGAIHFGPDGKLYVGVGDNGKGTNSQTLNNLFGKILRLNPDGTIPSNNPFYLAATGQNRAIWALGLRNPFSFAFHPQSGRLLINDVGETSWEEINEGQSGANYGWPNVEGITSNPAYLNPIFAYGHTGTNGGCAIVGGLFYAPTNGNFPPEFFGNYLFADYCNGWIRRLTGGNSTADFITGMNQVVAMQVGPDGALYVLRRRSFLWGSLYRISWKDRMLIKTLEKNLQGAAQLTATARSTHTYVLEASTNLTHWTSIQTNLSPTADDTVIFSDNAATNFQRRFYRIRE